MDSTVMYITTTVLSYFSLAIRKHHERDNFYFIWRFQIKTIVEFWRAGMTIRH